MKANRLVFTLLLLSCPGRDADAVFASPRGTISNFVSFLQMRFGYFFAGLAAFGLFQKKLLSRLC